MSTIPITRSHVRLQPDPGRLITKPYVPHDHSPGDGMARAERVIGGILAMPAGQVTETLRELGFRSASDIST